MQDDVPLLDGEHIAKLSELDADSGKITALCRRYLDSIPRQLERMRELLAAGDAEALEHEAHALAGSSGMYGMPRLRQYSQALQARARRRELEGAGELLAEVERTFAASRPLLLDALSPEAVHPERSPGLSSPQPRPASAVEAHKSGVSPRESSVLRLVQMKRSWGLPNISPACMKLETWLRMTNIPYEVAPLDVANAPKGKIPYVVLEDGNRLGDSTLIIEHLKARYGKDPDAELTTEQRAIALAFRRMMKEDLYWVICYSRYKDASNWSIYRQHLVDSLEGVPPEQRPAIADMYQKLITDQLQGQGMGRHSQEEVYRLGTEDVAAVSDFLGNKSFFMGERPTTVDATVYAYLANILEVPLPSSVKDFGLSRENLVRYLQRMRSRFFPDLPSPT
jgi:HPt (histidine-containing phosphotransfer) domain-containing protein/glutathione S-transferase